MSLISIINIICLFATNISTPLFIESFDGKTDPYFVLIFNIITKIIFSIILMMFNQNLSIFKLNLENHLKLLALGLIYTFSYGLITFASDPTKIPYDLQQLSYHLFLPFTIIINYFVGYKFLKK